jgi:hypothetical protein
VLDLTYDEPAARMDYTLRIQPALADRMYAVWIHSGTVEKPGAARHELFGARRSTAGSIAVSAADRADLAQGRLIVRFYLREVQGSAGDVVLSFRN